MRLSTKPALLQHLFLIPQCVRLPRLAPLDYMLTPRLPALIEDPIFSADAGVDMASIFGPDSAGLAGLLGTEAVDEGDDGYATTVEEEDFLTSTGAPESGDFAFPDLKSHPGIMVDAPLDRCTPEAAPTYQGLPMELAFSPRCSMAFASPESDNLDPDVDASTAALLQVLTQAALQQTQMQQQEQPQVQSPALETTTSPTVGSIAPRDVSPGHSSGFSPLPQPAGAPSLAGVSEASEHSRASLSPVTEADSFTSNNKRKRRVKDASDLLPMHAPVQRRTYLAPSATSRRELPEDDDDDPSVQAMLAKRRKNTLAARQSRRRKADEMSQLRDEKEQLAQHNAELLRRLEQVEQELAAARCKLDSL